MNGQIDVEHVRRPDAYEPVRSQARAELARRVQTHRVRLGAGLTLGFVESRTLLGVAEEQLRAERRDDDLAVLEAVDRVNTLAEAGLVALLILESDDAAEQAAALERLASAPLRVELVAGDTRVAAAVMDGSGADPVVVLHFAPGDLALLSDQDPVSVAVTLGERALQATLDAELCAALWGGRQP